MAATVDVGATVDVDVEGVGTDPGGMALDVALLVAEDTEALRAEVSCPVAARPMLAPSAPRLAATASAAMPRRTMRVLRAAIPLNKATLLRLEVADTQARRIYIVRKRSVSSRAQAPERVTLVSVATRMAHSKECELLRRWHDTTRWHSRALTRLVDEKLSSPTTARGPLGLLAACDPKGGSSSPHWR
ncbi:MAG: hypothetical protein JWO67_2185 [Streptosporangiaceae bacterium]|nr:hypothetical protein [Streptosporangiaceae bacterium]